MRNRRIVRGKLVIRELPAMDLRKKELVVNSKQNRMAIEDVNDFRVVIRDRQVDTPAVGQIP